MDKQLKNYRDQNTINILLKLLLPNYVLLFFIKWL